ncbi:GntR family transcriptional regulator [Nocardia mikamii]|uniref:GntR family transcriptional regulator n=1 Tax=Nocardia mikamii TaxID=508464 RepID=UPI0007A46CAD|nr:GntR family transcriptional regulator [Nocardia mikamii]
MAAVRGEGSPGRSRRQRSQLSDQVAHELRARIMAGTLRPGDAIHLEDTAAELDVSITPLRDALLTLRGEGFVEPGARRGFVVSELSRDDVMDVFWLQRQIANELARRAARRLTPEASQRLDDRIGSLRAAVAGGDAEAISDAEFAFHRELNRLARAPKLASFQLKMGWYAPHRLYSADRSWGEFAVASHERLVAAIRRADMDEIDAETRVLFADAAQRLLAHLDRVGMWEETADESAAESGADRSAMRS